MGSVINQKKSYSYTKQDYDVANTLSAIDTARKIENLSETQRSALERLIKIAEQSLRENDV